MTETISPGKSAINFGITFGIIMILQFAIMYVLDINPQETPVIGVIINLLNYLIIPFLFIYLAANNYKIKLNNGYISMGETIKVGLTVCAVAALMYGIFYLIFDFGEEIRINDSKLEYGKYHRLTKSFKIINQFR